MIQPIQLHDCWNQQALKTYIVQTTAVVLGLNLVSHNFPGHEDEEPNLANQLLRDFREYMDLIARQPDPRFVRINTNTTRR